RAIFPGPCLFNGKSSVDDLRIQLDRYRTSYAQETDDPVVSKPVRPPLYELLLLPVWFVILLLIWR
ncbi:hypothetical protein, partial [Candidatus Frankia alpina]|uniref:hypothetical protein n=1 Tax=Candidatus Frankia alpina TaxID=2699483 RepID=UPI001A99A063